MSWIDDRLASQKPSTSESKAAEIEANRQNADEAAAKIVEGFRKLAKQKAPNQAT